MLDNETRRALRARAHHLKPLVQIGRNGLTAAAIANIDHALTDHTLIKVKFNDHKARKRELSESIAESTGANVVNLIGNTLILYRES